MEADSNTVIYYFSLISKKHTKNKITPVFNILALSRGKYHISTVKEIDIKNSVSS
jgi:hypothetical protein